MRKFRIVAAGLFIACAAPFALAFDDEAKPAAVDVPAAWSTAAASQPAGVTPLTQWWSRFDDPLLGQLVRQALQANIAARRPFLDFVVHRLRTDGSRQQFRISGQPMLDASCRFTGYRGVGTEVLRGNLAD